MQGSTPQRRYVRANIELLSIVRIEVFLDEGIEAGEMLAVDESVVDADGYRHVAVSFLPADVYQREIVAVTMFLGE